MVVFPLAVPPAMVITKLILDCPQMKMQYMQGLKIERPLKALLEECPIFLSWFQSGEGGTSHMF